MHRPAVFFLSDGQPTEKEAKWQEGLAELKDPAFNERPNILAFGVGDADPKVIQQLATSPAHAFMMREVARWFAYLPIANGIPLAGSTDEDACATEWRRRAEPAPRAEKPVAAILGGPAAVGPARFAMTRGVASAP